MAQDHDRLRNAASAVDFDELRRRLCSIVPAQAEEMAERLTTMRNTPAPVRDRDSLPSFQLRRTA